MHTPTLDDSDIRQGPAAVHVTLRSDTKLPGTCSIPLPRPTTREVLLPSKPSDQHIISRDDLKRAVDQGLISKEASEALWRFLAAGDQALTAPPRFDVAHLLWYAGALIIIGAMGLFTSLAFSTWGGGALAVTALIYAVVFILLGTILWRRDLRIPGGLCITIAVTMTPLLVFGIQEEFGWWSQEAEDNYLGFYRWIRASWLPMEIATIIAGIVALSFYRFPFLIAPIAVAMWFMSMDLTPWIFDEDWNSFDQRKVVSLWFGLAMLALAWLVDVRARGDFAFWLHLFGLMAFWGGLSLMDSDSEIAKASYCLVNIGLLLLGLFLQRRAFAVFGALGITFYLHHLAEDVFQDSLLYPFALSLIGLLILGTGILYFRKQAAIEEMLRTHLPAGLQALRPVHAR